MKRKYWPGAVGWEVSAFARGRICASVKATRTAPEMSRPSPSTALAPAHEEKRKTKHFQRTWSGTKQPKTSRCERPKISKRNVMKDKQAPQQVTLLGRGGARLQVLRT